MAKTESVKFYVVRQGDCAASIAAQYGVSVAALMGRKGNQSLKSSRKNPYVLLPGDVVEVPEVQRRPVAAGNENAFALTRDKVDVAIRVSHHDGSLATGCQFEFVLDPHGEDIVPGSTGIDGIARARVRASLKEARLRVWLTEGASPVVFRVLIGHLDPETELSGVKQRLENLGFSTRHAHPSLAPLLKRFQRAYKLPVTGTADQRTLAKLVELNGC